MCTIYRVHTKAANTAPLEYKRWYTLTNKKETNTMLYCNLSGYVSSPRGMSIHTELLVSETDKQYLSVPSFYSLS
jgi:hypothetical protein